MGIGYGVWGSVSPDGVSRSRETRGEGGSLRPPMGLLAELHPVPSHMRARFSTRIPPAMHAWYSPMHAWYSRQFMPIFPSCCATRTHCLLWYSEWPCGTVFDRLLIGAWNPTIRKMLTAVSRPHFYSHFHSRSHTHTHSHSHARAHSHSHAHSHTYVTPRTLGRFHSLPPSFPPSFPLPPLFLARSLARSRT